MSYRSRRNENSQNQEKEKQGDGEKSKTGQDKGTRPYKNIVYVSILEHFDLTCLEDEALKYFLIGYHESPN